MEALREFTGQTSNLTHMMTKTPTYKYPLAAITVVFLLLLSACSADTGTTDDTIAGATTETTAAVTETTVASAAEDDAATGDADTNDVASSVATGAVEVGLFFEGALSEEATTTDCTLSDGTETTCFEITVAGHPVTYETGPFCPETITDTAEAGGIWFDGNGVYDVDGEFIAGLAELYNDDNWLMYDEDGHVHVTETAEEFEAAARPDVDPSLQNHCVEAQVEWLENGEPVTSTVLIPIEPVLADSASTPRGNLGVTLDGVVIAASAPVDAILGAYTIAAFDDCGGHYNPTDGYHMHGATGCSEVEEISEGDTAMFAYAMDGFAVFSPLTDVDSADLDACNGHETDEHGYHYHANNAAENQVIECLIGETVATAR